LIVHVSKPAGLAHECLKYVESWIVVYRKLTAGYSWWYSGYHACHWTQGMQVQTQPGTMDF
jgi:hypothetical protein